MSSPNPNNDNVMESSALREQIEAQGERFQLLSLKNPNHSSAAVMEGMYIELVAAVEAERYVMRPPILIINNLDLSNVAPAAASSPYQYTRETAQTVELPTPQPRKSKPAVMIPTTSSRPAIKTPTTSSRPAVEAPTSPSHPPVKTPTTSPRPAVETPTASSRPSRNCGAPKRYDPSPEEGSSTGRKQTRAATTAARSSNDAGPLRRSDTAQDVQSPPHAAGRKRKAAQTTAVAGPSTPAAAPPRKKLRLNGPRRPDDGSQGQ